MDNNAQLSRLLAEYVSTLQYGQLPARVVERCKVAVLDYLASAAAGWRLNGDFNRMITRIVAGMGGEPESTVMFSSLRLPACNVALLNAVYGHGADLDDGHRRAQGHPGVSVIPAVLALAESEKSSAEDVIAAIVAGYDVYIRVSCAIMPSHYLRGFHGTGTVGALAASAACARLLKLNPEKTHHAISLGALQASGLIEVANSGQMSKPINPAKAVHSGILSALLAREGAIAPAEPLTGKQAFFHAFTDEVKEAEILNGLGEKYSVSDAYIKLYPACRHTHGMIDCASELHERGIRPEDVEKMRLYIYPAALKVTGNIREPANADEAKFSLTYAAAVALETGGYSLDALYGAANMSYSLRTLLARTEIISVPELENRSENIRGAEIELELKNGRTEKSTTKLPHGEPELPISDSELRQKLHFCSKGVLSADKQGKIYDTVMNLEELTDIVELMSLFNPD